MTRRLRWLARGLLLGLLVWSAPALADDAAAAAGDSCDVPLAIDAHAHVWNAQDLAIEGFMRQVVLDVGEFDRWKYVKRPWLMLADFPYSHLVKFWLLPKDLVRLLFKSGQWVVSFSPKVITRYMTSSRWGYEKEAAALEEHLYRRSYCMDDSHEQDCADSEVGFWVGLADGTREFVVAPVWFLPDQLIARPTGISTYIQAIKRNRSSRLSNAQQVLGLYPGVDAFVTALVDFEYWVGSAPETTIEEQVDLLSDIAILSEGRLLPFVGYDPRRNIEDDGRALRNTQRAILEKGFVGVKLYPPMGFRPIGNAGIDVAQFKGEKAARDVPGQDRLAFGEALDRDLIALYTWAQEAGVPIMAHVNETNAVRAGAGRRASPAHWAEVNRRFPKLKLNVGHFGGLDDVMGQKRFLEADVPPPDKPDVRNWTWQIVNIVDDLGDGGNVYADTSMFSELLKRNAAEQYFGELKRLTEPDTQIQKRLLYGSDWMMLALKPNHARYYDKLCRGYRQSMPDTVDDYMGLNAASFLGLRRGEPTRERLDVFYGAHDVTPRWRKKLDAR